MQLHYRIDELKDFDFMAFLPILLPVILIGAALALLALIDLYVHRKNRKNVGLWTLIILLGNTLGPILYFILGRKDSERN